VLTLNCVLTLFAEIQFATSRVNKLFGAHLAVKKITNRQLGRIFAVVLTLEVMLSALWVLVPGANLSVGKRNTKLDANAYEFTCLSDDNNVQIALTAFILIVHSIPVLALTVFAYRVRLSFKYQTVNAKYDVFDESLYIMLALLNMTVSSLFIIVFQLLVSGNPDSSALMQCLGVIWVVAFTMGIIFVPKFILMHRWDPTKDKLRDGASTTNNPPSSAPMTSDRRASVHEQTREASFQTLEEYKSSDSSQLLVKRTSAAKQTLAQEAPNPASEGQHEFYTSEDEENDMGLNPSFRGRSVIDSI
jgi:hypothetical protein